MSAAQAPEPWLQVAHIVRPHGVRGELVAELTTDFPDRFTSGLRLLLRRPGETAPSAETVIEQARIHSGRLLLRLAGCGTCEDAEALRGWDLLVRWEERMPLDADAIYLADLAGATLIDRTTGDACGVILALDRESSSMDLLVVGVKSGTEDGTETLVPFARAYEPVWDADSRRLTMTLPEGLLALK